jgi:hypothetical protein
LQDISGTLFQRVVVEDYCPDNHQNERQQCRTPEYKGEPIL